MGRTPTGPLTVDDFLRLDEAEAFRRYAKTELIGGTIFALNAQFSAHARLKSRLFGRLADAVDAHLAGYEAWSEVSVRVSPIDLPEPDIVVTGFGGDGRAPVPVEMVALVVEVADTTIEHDPHTKARIYAGAGIAEYRVVDANARVVHQHWHRPAAGDGYGEQARIAFGDPIAAATIAGPTVQTGEL